MNLKTVSKACLGNGLAISALSAPVNAEEEKGFYTAISLGSGTFSDVVVVGTPFSIPFDYGFSYEGAVGYDFGRIRTEVSYNKTSSAVATGNKIELGSWMFNGFLDFPIKDSKFEPFIGLGYGSTRVDSTNLCTVGGVDSCTDDVGTWGFSIGTGYEISESVDLTGTMTYLGFDTINISDDGSATVAVTGAETLAFRVGVRFKF